MKRILVSVAFALLVATAGLQAQTRVSVSVAVRAPHIAGHVVLGRPYYDAYPQTVVVVGGRRVYRHAARVIVVRPGHVHRRHHRHHGRRHIIRAVGVCDRGGCR